MIALFEFEPIIGRFHPLVIHLPIGGVIFCFILEIYSRLRKDKAIGESVSFLLFLSGLGGILSIVSGYVLSLEGGYGEEVVNLHKWLGITTTAGVFITLALKRTRLFLPMLMFLVGGISLTGHYGGVLTHGENYLTEQLPESFKTLIGLHKNEQMTHSVSYEEARMYEHVIYPILDDKCFGCHNRTKMKGELNMKDFQAFIKGGENGPVIEKFEAEKSNMIKRIRLPESHDDTMPPEGKDRISEDELTLISFWINEDMQENTPLDSLDLSEALIEDIKFRLKVKEEKNPILEKSISDASSNVIASLQGKGFTVLPIEKESPFLQLNYFGGKDTIKEDVKKELIKISEQLVWLDLSGVKVENQNWEFLLSLENLIKLNLSGTGVTNKTVNHFVSFRYLESLNLFNTPVDSEILEGMYDSNRLKYLYLGNTEVNPKDTSGFYLKENETLQIVF